ncbi:MAG: hemerythrin domain-containing protein [Phycisphaerae bacterium]
MSNACDNTKPSAVLRAEHQVILKVLGVLKSLMQRFDRGEGFEGQALGECVEFFKFFADACHHAKEEDLLFPLLEERGIPRDGGPIGCMLEEHRQARAFTQQMADALNALAEGDRSGEPRFREAARSYWELLENHIFKEDNVLFTMGDQVMCDADQDALCGKFCEAMCGSFGGKKNTELEAMAEALHARWAS